MLENIRGDSWGSIPPLRMPSLLPHDLCHEQNASPAPRTTHSSVLNCGVGEEAWESLGLHRALNSPSYRKSVLNIHWKDWWWSWNSNTFATWCEELTHLKRPWCWERLKAGVEGGDRGWDDCMASPTRWTWIWVNSGSWWWTGRPGVLQSMGPQRVGHDWAELKHISTILQAQNWKSTDPRFKHQTSLLLPGTQFSCNQVTSGSSFFFAFVTGWKTCPLLRF